MKRITPLINVEDPLNKLYVKNIIADPVLTEREKKIIERYLTKVDLNLNQKQITEKLSMYFGYKKITIHNAISTLYEHWEGITERAVEKTVMECEIIKKEPSLARENS